MIKLCKLFLLYFIIIRFITIKDCFFEDIVYRGILCFNFYFSIIISAKITDRKIEKYFSFGLDDDEMFHRKELSPAYYEAEYRFISDVGHNLTLSIGIVFSHLL